MDIHRSTEFRFCTSIRLTPIHRHFYRLFLTVIVLAFLLAAPVAANEEGPDPQFGLGPFHVRSQSPAHSPRLTPVPRVPEKIIPGRFQAWAGGTWTNIWAEDKRYFLDYEMLNLDAELRYGVTPRLLIALGYNYRSYFGGGLDGFIQGFHDALNIEQQGRDEVPRNQSRMTFYDPEGNAFIDRESASSLQNGGISITGKYILHNGTDYLPAASISGTLKYWTNMSDSSGNDVPVDFGLTLGLSKRWTDRWYTYFSGAFTYHVENEFLGLTFDDTILSAVLGLEWRWRPTLSLIVQYLAIEGALEDFGQLSDPSQEITMGLKWQFVETSVLELGVVENIINHDNSPDFGLHVMVTHQF